MGKEGQEIDVKEGKEIDDNEEEIDGKEEEDIDGDGGETINIKASGKEQRGEEQQRSEKQKRSKEQRNEGQGMKSSENEGINRSEEKREKSKKKSEIKRSKGEETPPENPLSISWHDSSWIPLLNAGNVMEYFSERTNPFYDRTCNNENLKMQRLGPEHLANMIGLEYCLLHVQEPILYVIRKQHRHSPTQVTPIADYYINAGVVYQAPDLASVIGSRLLTTVHHMQSAFEEAASFSQYHPSKGYWWEFKENEKQEKVKAKEEPGSAFQRRRVDVLLGELAKKFPPKLPSPPQLEKQTTEESAVKAEPRVEIKTEKTDPPTTTTTVAATTTTATVAPTTVTAISTTTPPTTTTTTVAPLLPPPPPPAPTTTTASSTVTTPASAQRSAMKPPPEKRPRLL